MSPLFSKNHFTFRYAVPLVIFFSVAVVMGCSLYRSIRHAPPILDKKEAPLTTDAASAVGIKFVDRTAASGLVFEHRQTGMTLTALPEVIGPGACVSDIDRDGYQDIFAVNGSGFAQYYGKRWWWSGEPRSALFHNHGDGTFKDIAASAGITPGGWGMGCAFADYDGDGDDDLYVTRYGANALYRNNGDLTFSDVTRQAGVGDERWSTSAVWGDYDRDGDLDLYVVNFVDFKKIITVEETNSFFVGAMPPLINIALFNAQRNALYQNNGDGTFSDVAARAGVGNDQGKGLGAVFFDYDRDGDLDLYVTNHQTRNVLYRNNGDGTFADRGSALGVDVPSGATGVTAGDYDNDGDWDLFSTYTQGDANILHQNLGSSGQEIFRDVSIDSGLGQETSFGYFGWAAEWADFDNDGWEDLWVANGHIVPDFDNPQKPVGQRGQLFHNTGRGNFKDVSSQVGLNTFHSSRGAAVGDFDNDGDQDVLLVNNNDRAVFFLNENSSGHHWLTVKLTGKGKNTNAVGATIKIVTRGLTQWREVRGGSGFMSQKDQRPHFGLGRDAKVELIEIIWPDGYRQNIRDVAADQIIAVTQGEGDDHFVLLPGKKEAALIKKDGPRDQNPLDERERIRAEMSDPDPAVRRAAVLSLARVFRQEEPQQTSSMLKKREWVGALLEKLEDPDMEVRRSAVEALGYSESYRAVVPLLEQFQASETRLRLEAVKSIGLLRDTRGKDALLYIIRNSGEDASVRVEAVLSLRKLGEQNALAPLAGILEEGKEEQRVKVYHVLEALLDHEESVLIDRRETLRLMPERKEVHERENRPRR
jgi:hypothetical protein